VLSVSSCVVDGSWTAPWKRSFRFAPISVIPGPSASSDKRTLVGSRLSLSECLRASEARLDPLAQALDQHLEKLIHCDPKEVATSRSPKTVMPIARRLPAPAPVPTTMNAKAVIRTPWWLTTEFAVVVV
jgi:hypothetical protein